MALLDDPLSAVDAHVGRHLMQHAICGTLASSTRVLVTHQLQFLPDADLVIKLEKGRIVAAGSYNDLISQGVSFAEFKLDSTSEEDKGSAAACEGDSSPEVLGPTTGKFS